ncbi:MAG: mechanosensitive ion channel domain-containing protein [Pseudomonadota bacterium]
MKFIQSFYARFPAIADYEQPISALTALVGVALLAILANVVTRSVIVVFIRRLLTRTKSERDDILIKRRVFERLSQLAPAFVIYAMAPLALEAYPALASLVVKLSLVYMIIIGVLFVDGLINAGLEVYSTFRISRDFPVTSFAQVAKLLLYFLGFIATLSVLLGESPMTFIAGLGALAAVLMFVFKDLILGLVAGIQLSANRMVAVGDWIEMPKYGVDGDIMEIALTTVKIRNFDKTITTVPTQALINESFKNWRGMKETGGRRIKRSVHVDVSSIRFCDEEMLARYSRIQHIADYLEEKRREIAEYNEQASIDRSVLVNGRHLTNIGTFRAYIEAYLRNHPKISKNLTLLVRQLQPTAHGLPIEIYVFTNDTNWIAYEGIQADIFDHILAAASEFDLRIFQDPTGADFKSLTTSD